MTDGLVGNICAQRLDLTVAGVLGRPTAVIWLYRGFYDQLGTWMIHDLCGLEYQGKMYE